MVNLSDCIALQKNAAEKLVGPLAGQMGLDTAAYAQSTCELLMQIEGSHESQGMSDLSRRLLVLDHEKLEDYSSAIDTLFTFTCAIFVFLMQAGFAMLCAGSVRSKNTINILLKNVIDGCISAIIFWLIGYAFAYGRSPNTDPNAFIGSGDFAMAETGKTNEYMWWFFQWAFAAATTTILSGSVAERCAFEAYAGYAVLLSGWVYPVVAHWVWSGDGWMSPWYKIDDFMAGGSDSRLLGIGAIDFAGCLAVHLVGGLSGLIGAAFLGARTGRFNSDGTPSDNFKGHSATLVVLGTFLLWVGWYGFNPGSAGAITGGAHLIVSHACATTTLAGGAAGVTAAFWNRYTVGHFDLVCVCNGILAGLVSITSAASTVEPWAAVLIGAIGAVLFERFEWLILHKLKIDDPLSASAMHGGCGTWGALAVGLFARKKLVLMTVGRELADFADEKTPMGLFYGGNMKLFGAQFTGVIVIAVWVAVWMVPFFAALKFVNLLRVTLEAEEIGLDKSKHGGAAYEEPGAGRIAAGGGGKGNKVTPSAWGDNGAAM